MSAWEWSAGDLESGIDGGSLLISPAAPTRGLSGPTIGLAVGVKNMSFRRSCRDGPSRSFSTATPSISSSLLAHANSSPSPATPSLAGDICWLILTLCRLRLRCSLLEVRECDFDFDEAMLLSLVLLLPILLADNVEECELILVALLEIVVSAFGGGRGKLR